MPHGIDSIRPDCELREKAQTARGRVARAAAKPTLTSTAQSPPTEYSALNSFFLLNDKPDVYNLPEAPERPIAKMKASYLTSFAAAAGLAVLSALFFAKGDK